MFGYKYANISAMGLHSATLTWTSVSPSETSQQGFKAPSIADLLCLLIVKAYKQPPLIFFCPRSEGLDCIKIIEELSERVKQMAGMRNVVDITSAKVLFHPPLTILQVQNLFIKFCNFSGPDSEADPPAVPD